MIPHLRKDSWTDPYNVLGTSSGSEHTKNACPTSYIEYGLPFEKMAVVHDGSTIRSCSYCIF